MRASLVALQSLPQSIYQQQIALHQKPNDLDLVQILQDRTEVVELVKTKRLSAFAILQQAKGFKTSALVIFH